MIRTNISELKNRLSHYLRLVKAGEVVEIVNRKIPLARIEAVEGIQGNDFTRLDQVVSEKGKYTGALKALKKERDEGR